MRNRVIDALHTRSPEAAASGAFVVLDAVQQIDHPASRVVGLATAFRAFCNALGLDPMDALRVVERMERDCRYRQVNTLAAVRRYAENELRPLYG